MNSTHKHTLSRTIPLHYSPQNQSSYNLFLPDLDFAFAGGALLFLAAPLFLAATGDIYILLCA